MSRLIYGYRAGQARTYRPIREYGGWGIRYTFGKAYNVSGNKGVQPVFKNGKRLLIGSDCSEELAEAINLHMKKDTNGKVA